MRNGKYGKELELILLLTENRNYTAQEIADRLNFANQSFFGKYFKHHTGMSPKEYRRQ